MKAGIRNPCNALQGFDEHARYFARQYYEAEQAGIFEKLLAQMKKPGRGIGPSGASLRGQPAIPAEDTLPAVGAQRDAPRDPPR
jgi:hypothetical protein